MDVEKAIREFLQSRRFAVVGASSNREKYGNKCLRAYLKHGMDAVPIHPRETEVEGVPCHKSLAEMDPPPDAVSVITPWVASLRVVEECAELGIRRIWLQPGAESPEVLERARELGLELIAGGPCVLVALAARPH